MTAEQLKKEVLAELQGNILPWWMDMMPDPKGGWLGGRDFAGNIEPDAPKGLILNARILWTFSSAYRVLGKAEYLAAAIRSLEYISSHFIDREYGGAYWSLDSSGKPLDTKKQFYAIAFAIYGLAEYCRACGDDRSLKLARELFRSIEEHSHDDLRGGYIEACSRDWTPIQDMRLSDKDRNDAKTMNTHLHILEGYTALYRVWKDELLGRRLKELTEIFLDRMTDTDGHLLLFFDEDWKVQSRMQSYGHDIEASWLIAEAVSVLGDEELSRRAAPVCRHIAEAGMEGFKGDGMIYEWDIENGSPDTDRHWWVQAETVVGCYNMWQTTGERQWLGRCFDEWNFIKKHIICPDGEWWWSVKESGASGKSFVPDPSQCRAGFWKCPYHNGRMCLELIERI